MSFYIRVGFRTAIETKTKNTFFIIVHSRILRMPLCHRFLLFRYCCLTCVNTKRAERGLHLVHAVLGGNELAVMPMNEKLPSAFLFMVWRPSGVSTTIWLLVTSTTP